jgi:membrane-associated phospholipid phosphatase
MATGEAFAAELAPARREPAWRTPLRRGAPIAYGVFIVVEASRGGLPLNTDLLLLWIGGFLLACSITSPRRFLRGVVLAWLPLAAVLFVYDLLRGAADGLVFPARTWPQLRFDETVFGGRAPTVWLQERLWHGAAHLHWWDWLTFGVYVTHFFAALLLAAALWVTAHDRFPRYMVMICVLSLAGFATYALFPAVPPWMAAAHGALPPVTRVVPLVWSHVHVFSFNTLFETGTRYANDVAAMPSLHAAFATLVALTLRGLVRRPWLRALLLLYPLLMGLALVYGGEHYVADVLAGYLYAWLTYAGVNTAADAHAARRAGSTVAAGIADAMPAGPASEPAR